MAEAEKSIQELYPEHVKLAAISDKSQAIGEFLDVGLQEQGLTLAIWMRPEGYSEERLVPSPRPIADILAAYFDIDQKKIEQEKRAMLASLSGGE